MKREATSLTAQPVDVDAPRAKRHKPAQPSVSAASEANEAGNNTNNPSSTVQNNAEDPEMVKERGLRLWQVIKDATNKEGRALSHDFLRLPSKRQYPDYYEQIKRPVALDDIKRRLEHGQYAFFEEVKQDFEQCFKNAKKYNMKESQIWKDAKYLHKLVLLECEKLGSGEVEGDGDAADAGSGSEAEEGDEKKSKKTNKNRLLKSRLQKLVQKTADDGRVLAAEFMELPNRKLWPSYYKLIKRPRSFEMIFKRLKRREYETPLDFANDVELIFSNALEFNQEHTQIWDDAIVLRDYFRHLMSTLPAPFSIPAYANADRSTKIKLKVPAATQPQPVASTSQTIVSPKMYIPTMHVAPLAFVAHRPPLPPPPPAARSMPQPMPQSPLPQAPPMSNTPSQSSVYSSKKSPPAPPPPTFSPAAFNSTSAQYYPTPSYQSPSTLTANHYTSKPAVSSTNQLLPPHPSSTQNPQILTMAKSPTPPEEQIRRRLKYVSVVTQPAGRRLRLDWRDGVKTWAVRLGREETSVRIEGVRLMVPGDDDDEDSDDEGKSHRGGGGKDNNISTERHEEEEEEEEEPKPQQKRGRGRPRKKRTKATDSPNSSPKGKGKGVAVLPPEDVQVKLNGLFLPPGDEGVEGSARVWDVQVPLGSSVLEIGEPEGAKWRVYLERLVYS
ncbi:Bromodomain-containing protein [Irpex lacteus]|nr:Bromodomain-containing protein [Irpex lacteus]